MADKSSLLPGGDIVASTVVKQDPANTGYCLQAGAGDVPYGIAGPYTRRIAMESYDTTLIGKLGDPAILIYGDGEKNAPGRAGAAIANGQYLKPDASGFLIPATSAGDWVVARARASAATGDIFPVDVTIFQRSS